MGHSKDKDDKKYARYAKRIKIFNGLSSDEVSDILHEGRMVDFYSGKTIFHQGQLGSTLFIVFGGTVEIMNENKKIGTCKVGDCFGEMAVLNHEPHNSTAVAAGDVRVFTLSEEGLNALLEKGAAVKFLLNIVHVLSEHLVHANRKFAIYRQNAEAAKDRRASHYVLPSGVRVRHPKEESASTT